MIPLPAAAFHILLALAEDDPLVTYLSLQWKQLRKIGRSLRLRGEGKPTVWQVALLAYIILLESC
jgi:hypothetical protein